MRDRWWAFALAGVVVAAFAYYMYALTRYSISYGPDGPYYDLQVRHILRSWFPESNDPPLVYYYLVPFVYLSGDSYLGVKIGMSLIGALMAVPAFLVVETFTRDAGVESKVPALLCSFLIPVNVYCFRMIEDFMQNLAGVFFLLWFVYFGVRWFEDMGQWKKFGIPTVVFLACTVFTHVYPGMVAILLLGAMFVFSLLGTLIKTRKLPKRELLILGVLAIAAVALAVPLLVLYPSTVTNFTDRIQSYLGDFLATREGARVDPNYVVFLTVPYFLGIGVCGKILVDDLKTRDAGSGAPDDASSAGRLARDTILAWTCLVLVALLFVLVLVPSQWTERFVLLSFLPISLVTSAGLKGVERWLISTRGVDRKKVWAGVGVVAVVFAVTTSARVYQMIPDMGPIITEGQHAELKAIRDEVLPDKVDPDGIFYVEPSYHFGYWVEFVLDRDVFTSENLSSTAPSYSGRAIYGIFQISHVDQPFRPRFEYPSFPLTPFAARDPSGASTFQNPPPPPPDEGDKEKAPPPGGQLVYHGNYYEVRFLYYANGTEVPDQP
ncbi:MAG: ArnT family glycosyltransferase [Promethearchaeota archaeon]